ncbi:MAG: hypothetical protein CL912_04750 [Deltaproteobacteria bacterium]|nr:hypothetical protein [Deltaproteobacteria bacterium]
MNGEISWDMTEQEKSWLPRNCEDLDADSADDEMRISGMIVRPYFHLHDFLRPSQETLDSPPGTLAEHPEDWKTLGHFVTQFSGLRDLVWAAGLRIPPSVLSAISEERVVFIITASVSPASSSPAMHRCLYR